ncbi:MAG: hypothetical protein QXY40_01595 [Candidatus Methanomethylicia archaeon]
MIDDAISIGSMRKIIMLLNHYWGDSIRMGLRCCNMLTSITFLRK